MAPYSAINTGVYGFYGILCAPIVRLMGGSVTDMALFTAVLTGISVLCLCYVLDFMVSKPVFKILGAIGIGTFPVWERGGRILPGISAQNHFCIRAACVYRMGNQTYPRTEAVDFLVEDGGNDTLRVFAGLEF